MGELISADVKKEIASVSDVITMANAVSIGTPVEYEEASEILRNAKKRIKDLTARRKSITQPLDESKKQVMALFKEPLTALEKVKDAVGAKMIEYNEELERQRKLAQAEEEERARKQREKLAQRAAKAQDAGKEEKAEALEELADETTSRTAMVPTAEADGTSTVTKWDGEVEDIKALCAAVADGTVSAELVQPNKTAIRKLATALKGTMKIPGIKWIKNQHIMTRDK